MTSFGEAAGALTRRSFAGAAMRAMTRERPKEPLCASPDDGQMSGKMKKGGSKRGATLSRRGELLSSGDLVT